MLCQFIHFRLSEESQEVGCGTEAEGRLRRRRLDRVKEDMRNAGATEEGEQDRARRRSTTHTSDPRDGN